LAGIKNTLKAVSFNHTKTRYTVCNNLANSHLPSYKQVGLTGRSYRYMQSIQENRIDNLFLGLASNKSGELAFLLAFIAAFLEFPIQSITVFQEYYWGNVDLTRNIIKYFIKFPLFLSLSILFFLEYKEKLANRKYLFGFILFTAIISTMLIVILFSWKEFPDFSSGNLKSTSYHVYFYLIGYFLLTRISLLKRYRIYLFIGLAIMSLQILLFYNISSFQINYEGCKAKGYIHLLLGNSYAIWAILTLSQLKKYKRLILYLLLLPFLFALGSRASLYFYLLLLPVIIIETVGIKIGLVILSLGMFIFFIVSILYKDHRMFSIFSFTDTSLLYRLKILRTNLPDIMNNFIFGDYGGFYKYEFPSNTYIHNILSFWRQFGLIPFVLLLVLIIINGNSIFSDFKANMTKPEFCMIGLYIFLIASVLFAKAYNYSPLFLVLGYRDEFMYRKKQEYIS